MKWGDKQYKCRKSLPPIKKTAGPFWIMTSPYVWDPNAIPPLKIVTPKKNGTLTNPLIRSRNQHTPENSDIMNINRNMWLRYINHDKTLILSPF